VQASLVDPFVSTTGRPDGRIVDHPWHSRMCLSPRPRSSCCCRVLPGEASRHWSRGGGNGSTRPSGIGRSASRHDRALPPSIRTPP